MMQASPVTPATAADDTTLLQSQMPEEHQLLARFFGGHFPTAFLRLLFKPRLPDGSHPPVAISLDLFRRRL